MSAINVFQQNPGAEAKAQSPLHHADLASLVGKGRKNAGVTLRERKFLGHLTIRGDGHDPEFAAGVHKALGLELPVALTVVANNEMSLQWMGPDEWLLIVPGGQEFAVEQSCAQPSKASTSRWSMSAAGRACWNCAARTCAKC